VTEGPAVRGLAQGLIQEEIQERGRMKLKEKFDQIPKCLRGLKEYEKSRK